MDIKTPASHRDDPETSRIAEASMNEGKRFTHQRLLTTWVKDNPGHTAAEMGQLTGLGQHECARRLSEINDITVTRRDRRECQIKGTQMMTWYPLEVASKQPFNIEDFL